MREIILVVFLIAIALILLEAGFGRSDRYVFAPVGVMRIPD